MGITECSMYIKLEVILVLHCTVLYHGQYILCIVDGYLLLNSYILPDLLYLRTVTLHI